jgi:hypothetical protein
MCGQTHKARLIEKSLEIHLKHSTKRDGENENCRYEYFMKLSLADTAFHMPKYT